jgi:hypothetical protein
VEPERLLRVARRRLRVGRALRAAQEALWVTLAAGFLAQLGTVVVPYPLRLEWVLASAAAAAAAAAAVAFLWRPPTPQLAAGHLDRTCGLQDRLSTWLAVREGRLASRLVDRFLEDVSQAARGVRIREAVPLRLERWRQVAALAACVVVWDLWLSGTTLPHTAARRVAEVVRREGQRLGELAQAWELQARARGFGEAVKTAQAVRQVARGLASPRATGDRAQQELGGLRGHLRSTRERLQTKAAQLGASLGPEGPELEPWAVRAVERELRELGRALEEVSLSPEQAQQVRRALSRLQATGGLQPASPAHRALQQAQARLQAGDRGKAREDVRRAQEALRELARLLEEEGMLAAHQREVEASSLSIGTALQGAPDPEAVQQRPLAYPAVPRNRPGAAANPEDPETRPWDGPQYGLEPGSGHVTDKLGPATPRLEGHRRPEPLRGQAGEGKVYSARLSAPASTGPARTPLVRVSARVVRQTDEVLRAQRVPGSYREWVREYFAGLAKSGP